MPLFMDEHKKVEGLTAEAVAGAHKKDLETQAKHGVKCCACNRVARVSPSTTWNGGA